MTDGNGPNSRILYTNHQDHEQHLEVFGPFGNLGAVTLQPGARIVVHWDKAAEYLEMHLTPQEESNDVL